MCRGCDSDSQKAEYDLSGGSSAVYFLLAIFIIADNFLLQFHIMRQHIFGRIPIKLTADQRLKSAPIPVAQRLATAAKTFILKFCHRHPIEAKRNSGYPAQIFMNVKSPCVQIAEMPVFYLRVILIHLL